LRKFYDDDIERIVVLRQKGSQRRGRVRILSGNDADDDVKVRVLSSSGGDRLVRVRTESARGKKKQSKFLRPLEKSIRKRMSARSRFSRAYLELHNRATRRKRNGWLRELGRNMIKARRRARD
jgi:hypothetical protein